MKHKVFARLFQKAAGWRGGALLAYRNGRNSQASQKLRRGGQTVRGTVWPWGTLARGSPSSPLCNLLKGITFLDNLAHWYVYQCASLWKSWKAILRNWTRQSNEESDEINFYIHTMDKNKKRLGSVSQRNATQQEIQDFVRKLLNLISNDGRFCVKI